MIRLAGTSIFRSFFSDSTSRRYLPRSACTAAMYLSAGRFVFAYKSFIELKEAERSVYLARIAWDNPLSALMSGISSSTSEKSFWSSIVSSSSSFWIGSFGKRFGFPPPADALLKSPARMSSPIP